MIERVRKSTKNKILLITTASDLSADLLITKLNELSVPAFRWNLEDFPLTVSASWGPGAKGRIIAHRHDFPLDQFKSAWYRRMAPPGLPHQLKTEGVRNFITREASAFVEGLCETAPWFWVNRPSHVRRAENKLWQLATARTLGFAVPATLVTNNPKEAKAFLKKRPAAIVKSVASGAVEMQGSHWAIFTRLIRPKSDVPAPALRLSPCIFQEMAPKRADIRVTVIGSKMFTAAITSKNAEPHEVDWRALDSRLLIYRPHSLPHSVAHRCRLLMERLGLVYGCFDLVLTPGGKYLFLEINPSGQWGWIEHELGFKITESLARLLMKGKN